MTVLLGVGGGLVILCVIGILILLLSQKDVSGQVDNRSWTRAIEIEQFGPIQKEDWQNEIPSGAENISCTDQYRETRSDPAPKTTEVCGTAYTRDEGNGTGKVVQDCQYRVYDAYCKYTVNGWKTLRMEKLTGSDNQPVWPNPQLTSDQRAGQSSENYTIVFTVDGGEKTFETTDESLFSRATPGSRWKLKVNGLGAVVSIEPAN